MHNFLISIIFYTSLAGIGVVQAEFSQADTETLNNESPAVKPLLQRALDLERSNAGLDADWQAAVTYCEASRLGSAEAMYRLGMLYAFGRGVDQSRALAASLFSVASAQGHREAQNMLDTIDVSTTELPQCVVESVLPAKADPRLIAEFSQEYGDATGKIDTHVQGLAKKKRWVLDLVKTLSEWYKVDPKLVLSIITVESNFNAGATSNKSAMGLMQLIPATAERFNVKNAYDASQNIKGGMSYLRWLLAYFQGDVKLAVAAYNAGEGAVDRYKGVPPYSETRNYVKKVMELYNRSRHPFDPSVTDPSPVMSKIKKG